MNQREDDEVKEHQARLAKLRIEKTSDVEGKGLDQENDQPSGRSILELMRMKRRKTEMAGPAGKRKKIDK